MRIIRQEQSGKPGAVNFEEPSRPTKGKPPLKQASSQIQYDSSSNNLAWHQQAAATTLRILGSNPFGLTTDEAQQRLSRHGPNTLDFRDRRTAVRILLGQFTDFMILVLIAAAILSGIIGDFKDTIVIAAIVLLNGAIGFIQEYRAERALEALQQMAAPTAKVIRNGGNAQISAGDVVPGDIIVLEAGGIVPADLRLVDSAQLRTDESALTGESHPIEKISDPLQDADLPVGDRRNMAYMGTLVTHGRGRGVVVGTASHTEFGQIAEMLHTTEEVSTPLQRRLEYFGKVLAVVALLMAALIFALGVLRGEPLLLMLLTAITIAVAAIPEALPAVATISLALGAKRMVQKHALVRRLAAVEALGSVTIICADKTGTLTQNRMSVERFYCGGVLATMPGSDAAWRQLLQAMALSNDVRFDETGRPVGDPTEVAVLDAARQAGVHKSDAEDRFPRVAELPFDSDRKCMTTLHRDAGVGLIAFTKGAVESIVERAIDADSSNLTETLCAAEEMAAHGLRVLAFAVRRWPAKPVDLKSEAVERDLEIVGLVGIGDPIRSEVLDAVETCRRAGVRTVMITGDHPVTAQAIARQLGIFREAETTLTGRELARMDEAQLSKIVEDVRVYARVAPEQKLRIVRALQGAGHLVAMTGDGVNDAPALKQAEIGVAMGISGTDVAKQAGSLILLDDNFATIVRAVREGRKIYDNLRRFIRYAVTTNSSEILIMLIAPVLGLPMPLLPLQILWVNLVTDGLPGLAMTAEPEESNVMRRPPRHPSESIFAHGLGVHVVWVGILMAALAVSTEIIGVRAGAPAWRTMVLCVIAFSQLAHALAIRSETDSLFKQGLLSNKPLFAAVTFTVLLQLALIYLPAFHNLFGTQPLRLAELAWTLLAGSVVFAAVEIEKWIRRRHQRQR
jgi:Ca2+-transporting ATPase